MGPCTLVVVEYDVPNVRRSAPQFHAACDSTFLLRRNAMPADQPHPDSTPMTRRTALQSALAAAGGAALLAPGVAGGAAPQSSPDPRRASAKRYDMKKSINLWAFPYPQRMTLRECLQLAKDAGFDGIELNYDLENDLSPKASTPEFQAIRKMADDIG